MSTRTSTPSTAQMSMRTLICRLATWRWWQQETTCPAALRGATGALGGQTTPSSPLGEGRGASFLRGNPLGTGAEGPCRQRLDGGERGSHNGMIIRRAMTAPPGAATWRCNGRVGCPWAMYFYGIEWGIASIRGTAGSSSTGGDADTHRHDHKPRHDRPPGERPEKASGSFVYSRSNRMPMVTKRLRVVSFILGVIECLWLQSVKRLRVVSFILGVIECLWLQKGFG